MKIIIPAIIGLFLVIFGIYSLSFIKDVWGSTTGHITNTNNCKIINCDQDYDGYSDCKYSGDIELTYNYAGKSYVEDVTPTIWCGSDCCHTLEIDNTQIHIKFPDGNPDVVAYFTTQAFYPSYIPLLMAIILVVIGLLVIGTIISIVVGCCGRIRKFTRSNSQDVKYVQPQ